MCHQARSDQRSMVTVILQEGDNIPDVIRILNILHGVDHGNLYFWITKEKSRSGREGIELLSVFWMFTKIRDKKVKVKKVS